MAIEDGYVLAKCLSNYALSEALLQYEQSRKPRATKIQQMSKANAGLYHMHGGLLGRDEIDRASSRWSVCSYCHSS